MDRFIEQIDYILIDPEARLKSNMDRFIAGAFLLSEDAKLV